MHKIKRTLVFCIIFCLVLIAVFSIFNWLVYASTPNLTETENFQIISIKAGNPEKFASLAEINYQDIAKDLRVENRPKIKLIITSSMKEFTKYGGSEDIAGIAYPSKRQIIIFYKPSILEMVLRHEINHILFLGDIRSSSSVPLWFSEGLAIYHSNPGQVVLGLESTAFQVDRFHGDLALDESDFSGEDIKEISALGYFRIKFIAENYGQNTVFDIAQDVRNGVFVENALQKRTGLESKELDQEWEKYFSQQKSSSRINILRFGGFILIGLLALLAIAVYWFRKRIALQKMEAEEKLEHDDRF